MASTYQRSLVKGIVWEGFSLIITFIAAYLVFGDLNLSVKFSLGLAVIKMLLFFVHERAWKNVKWGKYQLSPGQPENKPKAKFKS